MALLVLFVVPTRYSIGPPGVRLNLTLILGFLALLTWICYFLFRRVETPTLNIPRLLLFAYLLNQLVAIAAAYRRNLTTPEQNGTYRELAATIGLVGLSLILCDGVRHISGLRRAMQLLLIGGYSSAAVGVVQRVFHYDYDTLWRNVPGLNFAVTTEEINGLLSNRATGTGSHPIEFSVACACLVPIALNQIKNASTPRAFFWHRVGIGLLLVGTLLGVSRAGFIGLVIAVLFSISRLELRQRFNAVAFGMFVLVFVQFGAHGTLSTLRYQLLNIGSDQSSKGRTQDYGPVFDLVSHHLWTGIGAGTYLPRQFRFLDNAWLGTLVSGGIIATTVLGLILVSGLYQSGWLRRRARDPYLAGLAAAVGVMLLILTVCAYFFDEFSFVQTQTLTVITLGILGAISTLVEREGRTATPNRFASDRAVAPAPRRRLG
ncbi:O-antigen ligase family protein [uncultured Jatrophihabitans sp.]|uniref:O-antigen ligase family protein n=1 Tax=uncultured Jatrophihabitans sp. TaxID=1610747 RepID=UPI0035CCA846